MNTYIIITKNHGVLSVVDYSAQYAMARHNVRFHGSEIIAVVDLSYAKEVALAIESCRVTKDKK